MAARSHAAVLLVLCAVLWSTGGLLIKWIAWPALAVAGMRSAIAAIVLLLVLREWRAGGRRFNAGLCLRYQADHRRERHLPAVYRPALCRPAEPLGAPRADPQG